MQTQNFIKNYPLIRLTIAYIFGISFLEYFGHIEICFPICSILCLVSLLILIFSARQHIALRFFSRGIFIYSAFVLAGGLNNHFSNRFNKLPAGKTQYTGIIVGSPFLKEKSVQLDCRIIAVGISSPETRVNEKVRLYLEPDSVQPVPRVGDSIFFRGKLSKLRNQGNPGEFNYARYMNHQHIHYSGYCKKTDYSFGLNSGRLKIIRLSTHIQRQLIVHFEKYNIRNDELAVLSALAAGNRNYLEQELRESYAAVGAMHILAVSGLHVGILYLILITLLGTRNQRKYYQLFRTLVILTAIWLYAFITGLSSSVMRAALMFSLFLIGKNLHRQINSHNILAASALIILLINPLELFKVGFQFSYLAVFGIIYFQPKLEQLIIIPNGIIDRVWQLFTVSIAAQLSTFPLSLYYFHQFPVYFWLTNMIVIPLVWIIMAGSVVFCFLIPLKFLLPFIATALTVLLKILNHSIRLVTELPFSTITEICFNGAHLIVFYLFLILFIIFIAHNYYKYILHLICILILSIILIDIAAIRNRTGWNEIIFYNAGNNDFVVSLIDGVNHTLITKGIDDIDNDNTIRYIKNYWIAQKINRRKKWLPTEKEIPGTVFQGPNLEIKFTGEGIWIEFYDTRYIVLEQYHTIRPEAGENLKETILMVNSDSGYPDEVICMHFAPDLILAGSSLTRSKKNTWKNFADNYGIAYYNITDNGAFHKINLSK